MPELIIRRNGRTETVVFEGTPLLDDVLVEAGIHTLTPAAAGEAAANAP